MKGFGSAYLWNLKKIEEKVRKMDVSTEKQQHILQYEREVCAYCPRKICEDAEDLVFCYDTYMEKRD